MNEIFGRGYDAAGRLECTAQRMDADQTTDVLPAACVPMPAGVFGEDRIWKRIYDTADRVTSVRSGVGTSLEQVTGSMAYTPNGKTQWVQDAMGNRTTYLQDGFDRNYRTTYPSATTPGTSNAGDYEQVSFDAAGNILTHRTRRNETFSYAYDNLGRVTQKIVPERSGLAATHTRDIYYGYDLFGGLTNAKFDSASGEGLSFNYNALGQVTSAVTNLDGQSRTLAYQYDVAGRQTRITHPDGAYWTYVWDNTNRLQYLKDQSNISLITHAFWGGGQTFRRLRDSAAPDEFYYLDAAKRIDEIFTDHATATYDVHRNWTLNPAGQVIGETVDNNIFADDPLPVADVDYQANGLNQYAQVKGFTQDYDLNGNLTVSRQSNGSGGTLSTTFVYDPENRLVSSSGGNTAGLRYDPFGRLYEVTDSGGGKTRFHYDGDALIGEYNTMGTMLQRYIHGPGAGDDPLIRYPGTSVARTNAYYLYADRLGSIVQEVTNNGTITAINSYDAYGKPGPSSGINNLGRFRYTGQTWIPELGMYYYKARMYSPTLGRFMQTDPIGYADGMNIYAYVGNNPLNFVDPTGTEDGPYVWRAPDFCDRPFNYGICSFDLKNFGGSGLEIIVIGRPFQGPVLPPQNVPCSSSPSDGILGSARAVLETTATGADIATVGFVAGGITAPVAVATKLVGYGAEAGLLAVNLYDGFANDSWGGLQVQGAGAATRLIPGGRTLQSGLRAARGPTGILRNSRGQFRTSHINNPGVAEAGDLAIQNGTQAATGAVVCR